MKYVLVFALGWLVGGTLVLLYPHESHQVQQHVTQKADAVGKALSK